MASGFPSTISAGGGCSHGNPTSPSGIAKVDTKTGEWKLIADVGAWLKTHPAQYTSAGDFEPDGTLYSAIAYDGGLVTVEPNHGQVLSVSPRGTIRQMVDISAAEGHIVPTAIAERYGAFYVGNLNLFPINQQWSRILTISNSASPNNSAPGFGNDNHDFHIIDSKAGFTTVASVKFGPDGLLYVLELSDGPGYPTPGFGKVVRVTHAGEIEDVVTGLSVPTGMEFGTGGHLYVSNWGAAPAGAGQVLRFNITPGW